MSPGTSSSKSCGPYEFSCVEVGGGKNMYDDYSQVFVSPWNVRNVSDLYYLRVWF